jgi:hypothetical protein
MKEIISYAVRSETAAFFDLINHPLKFKLFLLKKLPAAFFSGLRIVSANEKSCAVSIPYKWFTQNPFRSTYFSCLAMAAEMSTGALVMANTYKRKPAVSMLIINIEGSYHKKATGTTVFTCEHGMEIRRAVEEAIAGQPQTIRVRSAGSNSNGEIVAEFWFTWSIKFR